MKLRLLLEAKPGHIRLASSLNTTPEKVKKYLEKLEKNGTVSKIKAMAKSKDDPDAYKWGTLRKILHRHFSEKQ